MKVIVRKADYNNSQEIDLIIGRSMESILESVPEFDQSPNLARLAYPNFHFDYFKSELISHERNPSHLILVVAQEIGDTLGHIIVQKHFVKNEIVYGKFLNLYIDTAHRRFGLGSLLINEVISWAKEEELKYLLAKSHVKNIKAQYLYKKCGFQITNQELKLWPSYEYKIEI